MTSVKKSRTGLLGVLLAGLGLILSGFAIWFLLYGAQPRSAGFSAEFTAVPAPVDIEPPDLRLADLGGSQWALRDYRGQVVLVNLWATWCPPCAEEMPILQAFFDAHDHEGFKVIAINDGEPSAVVKAFAQGHQLTFPIWLDPHFEATDRAFKTRNLPTSYVLDRAGRIRLMWIGAISRSNLEKYVAPLIKE